MTIDLSNAKLIGKGGERDCYQRPLNPNLCIKITVRAPANKKTQNIREPFYYKLLTKQGIDWTHIARYHGRVMTNRGEGLIFDLPPGPDGKPSHTLELAIERKLIEPMEVKTKLEELHDYLNKYLILTYDLRPGNVILNTKKREKKTYNN